MKIKVFIDIILNYLEALKLGTESKKSNEVLLSLIILSFLHFHLSARVMHDYAEDQ